MAPLMIGATVGITVMLLLLDNVALWAEKELALLALGLMERGLAESRLTCRCPSYDELRISPGDEGVPAVSNRPKVDERRERGDRKLSVLCFGDRAACRKLSAVRNVSAAAAFIASRVCLKPSPWNEF